MSAQVNTEINPDNAATRNEFFMSTTSTGRTGASLRETIGTIEPALGLTMCREGQFHRPGNGSKPAGAVSHRASLSMRRRDFPDLLAQGAAVSDAELPMKLTVAGCPSARSALFSFTGRPMWAMARSLLHSKMSRATMAEKRERPRRIVADNRKARFNYEIGEVIEAGIALTGTEVKSLRNGRAAIAESYADAKNGEIWLINANIPEYLQASRFNHAPKRPRKLLLHKRQIRKLAAAVEREGMTIVPLRLFFNDKGRAKIDIALGRGKKLHDKRETEKKRSWDRERGRLMRLKG